MSEEKRTHSLLTGLRSIFVAGFPRCIAHAWTIQPARAVIGLPSQVAAQMLAFELLLEKASHVYLVLPGQHKVH